MAEDTLMPGESKLTIHLISYPTVRSHLSTATESLQYVSCVVILNKHLDREAEDDHENSQQSLFDL